MRKLIGLLAVISVGSMSPVFATDPPATTTTSATSKSSSEAASSPAKTDSASASKGITAQTSDGKIVKLIASDEAADKQLGRLKAAGYKPEMHGEQLVFCRREVVLGSRFEKKVCSTADELEAQTTNSQDEAETMRRTSLSGNPSGR